MNELLDMQTNNIFNEIDELFIENDFKPTSPFNSGDVCQSNDSCSKQQFCFITLFPGCELSYLSPNFQKITGYDNAHHSLQSLLKLVHPDDIDLMASSYKNSCEFILNNYKSLPNGANILSLKFRIRHQNNYYAEILITNYLLEKHRWSKEFKILSCCQLQNTDLTKTEDRYSSVQNNPIFPLSDCAKKHSDFTVRELEILKLLATGKSSHDIGEILNISKHTVDTHRRKMLSKTKLCNTAVLIAYSISNGLIS